ncbi:MAG: hypothetical protein LBH22_09475, partial [Bacteroidales bacterium]|nr:hypothetical protein [Bacteroidales bacterium]
MTNKIKHRISSKMLNGLVAPKFKKLRSMAVCLVLTVLSLTAIPAAAQTTGTLTIGTTVVVPDLTQDGSGTGWTWNAATSTFTVATLANINGQIAFEREGDMTFILNGNVTGNVVFVGVGGTNGGAGGNVNFTVSGLRSIDGGIVCTRGRLTISGAGGGSRLSVTRTSGEAIYAQNGLTIGNIVVSATVAEGNATAVRVPSEGFTMASGSLNASGRLQGISIGGDANISGTAAVTAVSRSNGGTSDDVAMFLSSGSLTIGGSATVTANGYSGTGIWCSRGITINGGNV